MAKATTKKKIQFWGTGRRKKAIARVRLIPAGDGAITINKKSFACQQKHWTLKKTALKSGFFTLPIIIYSQTQIRCVIIRTIGIV